MLLETLSRISQNISQPGNDAIVVLGCIIWVGIRLSESIKQNDQVYHELIPNLDTLEPAPGI